MEPIVKHSNGSVKKHRRSMGKAHVKSGAKGRVDVISPATASEIRRTLGIGKTQLENVRRAFAEAGVAI